MKISNITDKPIYNTISNSIKECSNNDFDSLIKKSKNDIYSEQVGYVHYANPDVELRMYKVENDSKKMLYKVETSKNGKLVQSQIIDPETVNPNNATSEELLALNNYLRDKNIYTNNFSIIDSNMMAEYHSARYNALDNENLFSEMQLDSNNIESYLLHKKLLDFLKTFYYKAT